MTILRGYTESLSAIHLTQALQARALCGARMHVVYVGSSVPPLTHPRVCRECLTHVVGPGVQKL